MMKHKLWLMLLSITMLMAGCADADKKNDPEPLTIHEKSRTTWQDSGVSSYQYTYSQVCFCVEQEDIVVTVIDGAVTEAYYTPSDVYLSGDALAQQLTINDFFDLSVDRPNDDTTVTVSYNDKLGYPEKIVIDAVEAMLDAGVVHIISDVQNLVTHPGDLIWHENSERIVIHQTGGLSPVNIIYDYDKSLINATALALLQKISVQKDNLQCWNDAYAYQITISNNLGLDNIYFDDVNVCGGNTHSSHVSTKQIVALINAFKQQSLTDQQWVLRFYGHQADAVKKSLVLGADYQLHFDGAKVNGNLDCNLFSADYNGDANRLQIGAIAETEMFCANAGDAQYIAQNSTIKTALNGVVSYNISGSKLTLTSSDGVQLIFFKQQTDDEMPAAATDMKYSVIHSGLFLSSGEFSQKSHKVLVNQQQYQGELKNYSSDAATTPDFSAGKILRLDLGMKNTGGYSISLSSLTRFPDYLHARVVIRQPGPNCMVDAALSNPYQFIWIPSQEEIMMTEEVISPAC